MTVFPQVVYWGKRENGMDCIFITSHHDPGTWPGTQLLFNKCYLNGWKNKWMIVKIN